MSILQKFFGKKGSDDEKLKGKTCSACGAANPLDVRFCSSCGNEFHVVSDVFDAFISYRRESGSDLASLLKLHLESRFHKMIFLDVNELQVGRFDEELLLRIENTPNFIVILSRASLDRCVNKSDWLKREIMHALKTERNIIPVLTEGFTFPSDEVWALLPSEMKVLPSLNGVNYSHIHQDSAIRKIASYIKTQAGWPGKQVNQYTKDNVDPSVNAIPEPSLQKPISEGSRNKEPERKEIKPDPTGKKDISFQNITTPVKQENPDRANQQKEVLIGTAKIISKTVETTKDNSVKLGTIKIVSLPNKTEGEFLTKIGKIKIKEL